MRALILAFALGGCVVHEEVRIESAPCAVEPPILVSRAAPVVTEDPVEVPHARSISLGYIGDEPLTERATSSSGSGHPWQDYMRRGSWGQMGTFRSYPRFRPWRGDPAAYGYSGR